MKKYLLILALAVALPAGAQRNNRGDNEADRSARATERIERQAKSLVKELDLIDADAEVFTKLYVEYQDTLRGLRASQPRPDRRQKRDEITDEEADRRITSAIAFSRQEADLKEAYYAKFREHFSPSQLLSVFERRPMVMPRQGNNNRPPFGGPQGGGFGPGW